jgi:hypothetical protein
MSKLENILFKATLGAGVGGMASTMILPWNIGKYVFAATVITESALAFAYTICMRYDRNAAGASR